MNICKRGLSVCILVSVNELHIRIPTSLDVVSAEATEVFAQNQIDFPRPGIGDHLVEHGTVESRT